MKGDAEMESKCSINAGDLELLDSDSELNEKSPAFYIVKAKLDGKEYAQTKKGICL